jgi:hypothetical protein
MTTIATRLIAGSAECKTRLHDQGGERVSASRLLKNGSRAFATGIGRVLLGWRPRRPWISYDAQAVLARHLTKSSRVLEFGSGMSTLWYADRVAEVFSLEEDAAWFAAMQPKLPANATVKLALTQDEYLAFPEQSYDLIMVDGHSRNLCIAAALPFLAPGGIIYLDNSDRARYGEGLRAFASYAMKHPCEIEHFTDFAPTQFFAARGTMLRRTDHIE